MNDEDRQLMCEMIEKTVKTTVNGKIDKLQNEVVQHNERHEADMILVRDHIKTVEPYLQGAAGVKFLGNGLKWIAGIAAAYLVIKSIFP